mgnify:CR=1 FL=1
MGAAAGLWRLEAARLSPSPGSHKLGGHARRGERERARKLAASQARYVRYERRDAGYEGNNGDEPGFGAPRTIGASSGDNRRGEERRGWLREEESEEVGGRAASGGAARLREERRATRKRNGTG